MQNRASCQRGRHIPGRHAIRSFRYAFANNAHGNDREASEKEREEKKKGRVADWAATRGRERSIFIQGVRDVGERKEKREREMCDIYTHTRTTDVRNRHCHVELRALAREKKKI